MWDLPKPHADKTSKTALYPSAQDPNCRLRVFLCNEPLPFSFYLGIRGNRCPCSWLVSGREPGDTLQCRTGHAPSCRCSVCTRPGSRSPPPRKTPPQVLCTPPCPFPLADRSLTHLERRRRRREEGGEERKQSGLWSAIKFTFWSDKKNKKNNPHSFSP